MDSDDVQRWLLRETGRRGPVIEIGCGDGALSIELARRGIAVTAVDHDNGQLRIARKAADDAGVTGRIAWLQTDGQQLAGVPSGAYRTAVLAFVLHHLNDPMTGLRAAWRVLRPGGRLVVAEMLPRGPEAGDACHRTPLGQWLVRLARLSPDGVRFTVLPGQEWLLATLQKPVAAAEPERPPSAVVAAGRRCARHRGRTARECRTPEERWGVDRGTCAHL